MTDAEKYRLAQAARLIRFCNERGLDPHEATPQDLSPILDVNGKIVPEAQDLPWPS